ncbi:serine/threonine-protein kinase [Kribbella sp. NPDC055110]
MRSGELIAGRYELIERLGRGGMGEVWTCRDRELHREVAVKLLALDESVPDGAAERFVREAVAAAQINHPNVAALHDRGVDQDYLFLVMERVDGTTLTAQLRDSGPLPPGRSLEIAQEICAALVAAHKAGVIHYDIKPLNVMLTADGRVKVVDFGIAGFVQTTFTVARSADLPIAGTPEYGAPEQFSTDRGDERSDLYALGGVLFTLLTGQPPYGGPNGFAVVRRKLAEDAPSVAELRPGLPPAVCRLVDDLLRRDPGERPQSAAEVHDRIARLRSALDTLDLSDTETVVDPRSEPLLTRRLPVEDAFDITWPGEVRHKHTRYAVALVILWSLVVIALVAAYYLPDSAGDTPNDASPREIALAASGFIALVAALPTTLGSIFERRRIARARPWSLRIDADGITTADVDFATPASGPSGRRRFRWTDIETVTLERVTVSGQPGNQHPALCVRFASETAHSFTSQPAGWGYSRFKQPSMNDGWKALCILGPIDELPHDELTQALDRHAGARWHPEID